MKYFKFFLSCSVLLIHIAIQVKGCHYASHLKKRSINSNEISEVRQTQVLRQFFTNCMRRKARNAFESWESVLDYSVLDTNWFQTSANVTCRRKDTAACWKDRLNNYMKRSSPLFSLAAQCIDEYEQSARPKIQVESICTGAWTRFFELNDPSVFADPETLERIKQSHSNEVCSNPTAADVKLMNGNCRNQRRGNGTKCPNYQVRYCCPEIVEPICAGVWTRFFELNNSSAFADPETIERIEESYPREVCSNPTAADAKLMNGDCRNQRQLDGTRCPNYQVRYCCPNLGLRRIISKRSMPLNFDPSTAEIQQYTTCLVRNSRTLPTNRRALEFNSIIQLARNHLICNSFGSSDCFLKKFESLSTKTLNQLWPYLLQALSRPRSSISAQVTTCNMEEFPLSDILPTGIISTPPPTPVCRNGHWTKFFDRDNPNGNGDYETLRDINRENPGDACSNPTAVQARVKSTRRDYRTTQQVVQVNTSIGLICENRQQTNRRRCLNYEVRFCCPRIISTPPPTPVCRNGHWTKFFDRDNPNGNGDYETLRDINRENPGDACSNPTAVQARVKSTRRDYRTTQQVVQVNTSIGLICENRQQTNRRRCLNYEVRFCCPRIISTPPPTPVCRNGHWTKFFDRDNPNGNGDYETLRDINRENPGDACSNPTAVQARVKSTRRDYRTTQQVVQVNTSIGLICENRQQTNRRRCLNYEVRFCCPRIISTPPPTPVCRNGHWTKFFDRDNPNGNGDYETLRDINRENPGDACSNPTAVQARVKSTRRDYRTTQQVVQVNTSIGLICENRQQTNRRRCLNYEVRFCCPRIISTPPPTPVCRNGHWTKFFDRDNPNGNGDYETLRDINRENPGDACSNPTAVQARVKSTRRDYRTTQQVVQVNTSIGLICENRQQTNRRRCLNYEVRFCCPRIISTPPPTPVCRNGHWTKFFDRDNPNGNGDYETLRDINRENPGDACSNPTAVQARVKSTRRDYRTTQQVVQVNTSIGLICENRQQTNRRRCLNYEVRFCCPRIISTPPPTPVCRNGHWTKFFDRDNPNGNGDYETLRDINRENPGDACSNPTAVQARVKSTRRDYRTTQQVVQVNTSIGLICENRQQTNRRRCLNYEVRFCCPRIILTPPPTPVCRNGHWTKFFDRDNPNGNGDYETLRDINRENPGDACSNPTAVQARVKSTRRDYRTTQQVVQVNTSIGLICENRQQTNRRRCLNYEVRFCCPRIISTPPPTPVCRNGHWTKFFDRDNPNGNGDYETLRDINRENPGDACSNPTAVQARVKSTRRDYRTTQQVVQVNTSIGLICENRQQTNRRRCLNYEVRFCCPRIILTPPPTPVCRNGHWTKFFDRDNPNGNGDYETLRDINRENPGDACSNPTAVQARVKSTRRDYRTTQQVVQVNTLIGLICENRQQTNRRRCLNYEVRFCCPRIISTPPPTPVCRNGHWTKFFDRDNPNGNGDYETLRDINRENPGDACSNPTAVQARVKSTRRDYRTTQQVVQVNTLIGLICENRQQTNRRRCLNYEVRFCCPRIISTPPPTPVCRNGHWTKFFDRDNPNGNGDYETLRDINRENPGDACSNPTAVQARVKSTRRDYRTTQQVVQVNTLIGLICENRQQTNRRRCLNYEVRFCCPRIISTPPPTPVCRNGHWTKFFDRDNPNGNGDYETLRDINRENPGDACSNPTAVQARVKSTRRDYRTTQQVVQVNTLIGLICENRQQTNRRRCLNYEVRFCCPRIISTPPPTPVCRNGHWTKFFDRDNPNGNGDYETLRDINRENPGDACSNPTAVQARVKSTRRDYRTTQQVVQVNTSIGLICENRQQTNRRRCLNYEVRFCCPRILPPVCRNGRWTKFFDRDIPNGNGDYETLRDINRENPGDACSNPTAVQARVKSTRRDYRTTQQVVQVNTSIGLICENRRQTNRRRCLDYEVRFCCPRNV